MIFPDYPGHVLKNGDCGQDVMIMQACLNYILNVYPVSGMITGEECFSTLTENAVKGVQSMVYLPQTGIVDEKTWDAILSLANFLAE